MLRKRSGTISSKQGLMSDHSPLSSPTDKYSKPTSSIFSSPRLFTAFSAKGSSDSEAVMSPTSILDSKPFSGTLSPVLSDKNTKSPELSSDHRHRWEKVDSRGVGLGIVDALKDDEEERKSSKSDSRMVLFGSQLKIQIPLLPPSAFSPAGYPASPTDFGIKTRKQSGLFSPGPSPCSGRNISSGSTVSGPKLLTSRVCTGSLSTSEMELSEDYTCVICHGPNPRTTHIFDNCIVESCCGVGISTARKENGFFANQSRYPSADFLSFCYACKKKLGQGKDIYMYRGEKAFCSRECRYQEMMSDEVMERGASDSSASHYDDIFA